ARGACSKQRPWGGGLVPPQCLPTPRERNPVKLTNKVVAALTLPAGKAEHIEWDDELPRFGLRLRRSHDGKRVMRSWTVQYRHGGRKPRIKVGAVETLGAEQARAAARKILAAVDLGQNPQADRRDR